MTTSMEELINSCAKKIKNGETTLAKVAIAINTAVEDIPVRSFKDVLDTYAEYITIGKTTYEAVEEQLCGKKR